MVLRAGIHYEKTLKNTIIHYDYHFWYQTYDGRWANKHGSMEQELLPVGTTPFTEGSSGWALGNYEDFYDGEVYSYIITVN